VTLENSFCLTIDDRRYNYLCETFKKYNLNAPKKYNGFSHFADKEAACLYGHMAIVMMARCLKFPYVCIFEDDAYPRKDIAQRLEYYISNKPWNCGIMVLGRNGQHGPVTDCGEFYTVVKRPFGAHAYIVYENCYDQFLSACEKTKIADIALKGELYGENKPYWTKDNLFIQKNINKNCMSLNLVEKHGRYFYPNPETKGLGVYNTVPQDGMFEEDNFVLP